MSLLNTDRMRNTRRLESCSRAAQKNMHTPVVRRPLQPTVVTKRCVALKSAVSRSINAGASFLLLNFSRTIQWALWTANNYVDTMFVISRAAQRLGVLTLLLTVHTTRTS